MNIFKRAKHFFKKHAAVIRTGISIIGVGLTSYFVYNGTKKIYTTGKTGIKDQTICLLPAIITGTTTIAVIIFNHNANRKTIAAALTCCGISAKRYEDLNNAAEKVLGRDGVNELKREIAREYEEGVLYPISPSIPVENSWGKLVFDKAEDGDVMFFDPLINDSGLWFRTSKEAVRLAWIHILTKYASGEDALVYDFYRALGIIIDDDYQYLGWHCVYSALPSLLLIESKPEEGEETYYILDYTVIPDVFNEDFVNEE